MKLDFDKILTLGARNEKDELIERLLQNHSGSFQISGNSDYDELKVRAMIDRIQMNGIRNKENIELIFDFFVDRKVKNSQVIKASRILLDPQMAEEQKMLEISQMVN